MSDKPMEPGAGDVDEGADLLAGVAYEGPLDGGQMTSRRPAGVLLVDRPAGRVWRYAWRGDRFVCLDEFYGRQLVEDPGEVDNRERAAEEGEWDVQAAPWVGGDPDVLDPQGDPGDLVDADDGDGGAELGDEVVGPIDETEG